MSNPPEGSEPTPAPTPPPPVWPPHQPPPPQQPPVPQPSLAPPQVPAATYPAYAPASTYGGQPARPQQNGMGIAALVLSILGLVGCIAFVGSILGIIFGIIGMKNADRGLADNRSVAKAGLIVGIIGLGLWVLLAIVWAVVLAVLVINEPHSTHIVITPSPTGF